MLRCWDEVWRANDGGGGQGASMSKIRILHVVHSLGTGGTETGVRKLLLGLDQDVFEQTVCTVLAGPATDRQTGAHVVSLGRSRGNVGFLLPDFYRVFRRERPHVVHARNWGTVESVPAARLARVPGVIYSEHGLDVHSVSRQPWRRNAFRRLCFWWADRVFAVSEGLRDYFTPQLPILGGRLLVVPNGVDTELFRPVPETREEMRRELALAPDLFVVGTVSRLDPVKDHRTLLRAAELLLLQGCALRVLVVGNGPERAALEGEVQASSLLRERVVFVGERGDVPRWLQCFDAFVLPSLAEGMSNTLLEAMASGIAPVASRVGGNPEVIEEGRSGLLFDAGDANALAACLKILALNRDTRCRLGTGARQRVQSCFDLREMLENYTELYESVLAGKRRVFPVVRSDSARQQPYLHYKDVETSRKSS